MTIFPIVKTLLHSLFGRRVTLKYPAGEKRVSSITRGRIENDINTCIFCGICQSKCPTRAIIVNRTDRTWSIARYDCMQCGRCAELCPKKCLSMTNVPPDAVNEKQYYTLTPAPSSEAQQDDA